jgi:hypothetical protein
MRTLLTSTQIILLMTIGSFAQQPAEPRFQNRLQGIVRRGEAPATKNYQLELMIQHPDKSARYKLTLSSGTVSTELLDRLTERIEGAAPLTLNFNASLIPFEEGGGGEITVNLTRTIPFKTKAQVQGAPSGIEKEVTSYKTIPLLTKVALSPGKPIVIFEDEAEKVSLKLTDLESEAEKP